MVHIPVCVVPITEAFMTPFPVFETIVLKRCLPEQVQISLYAVGKVTKFLSKPSEQHWIAVKRITSYLNGTVDYGRLKDFQTHYWAGD